MRAPEVSEDAIARAFTAQHRDRLRFDHQQGRWFEFVGTHWQRDERKRAFDFARRMCVDIAEGKKAMCRASVASGVERFAQADPLHAATSDIWDQDDYLLGTPGGTVDLRSGRLLDADPNHFITKVTRAAPEHGQPERWLQFLEEVTQGDPAFGRFLQQIAGYALTGDTREHALFVIFGVGRNGKSVFLNTLARILGDYAVTAAMETFTAAKGDRHTTELAMLQGARLVTASETEDNRSWAEARIKQITGGDPITARFMRQDNFTFQPRFKLLIVGNHQPTLHNVDVATRRRFNMIPFTHVPAAPDTELERRLEPEYGRILAWMIEGCLDWQRNGLVRPQPVLEATEEYFEAQDLMGQWVEEACVVGKTEFQPTAHLFASWSKFARAAGEDAGSSKSFGMALQKRHFRRQRKTCGWCYVGLSLRPAESTYEDSQSIFAERDPIDAFGHH